MHATWPRQLVTTLLSIALIGVTGCSGGDDAPAPPPPPSSLALDVVFPPPRSLYEGDEITVRGTTVGSPTVELVEVAGVAATSTDGFRTWQVTLPLAQGDTTIDVRARGAIDGAPREEHTERAVSAHPLLDSPRAIEVERAHDAWVVETGSGLLVIDRATGARRRVPVGGNLTGIDGPGQRAFLVGCGGRGNLCSIAVVSLLDGSQLFDLFIGWASSSVAVDEARERVIHHDSSEYLRLYAADLSTGAETLVWKSADDPAYGSYGPIAFDAAHDRVLGTDGHRPGRFLAGLDLGTGVEEVLSPSGTEAGADFDNASKLCVTAAGERLYAASRPDADATARTVLAVDLATGERHELSGPSRGTGVALGETSGLALEESKSRLLAAHPTEQAIVGIDLTSGDRSIVLADRIGEGPPLAGGPFTVDRDAGRAYLVSGRRVLEIDLATGDRRVVTDDADGAKPQVCEPSAITALGDRLWVAAYGLCGGPKGTIPLVEVDRRTGIRTLISADARGEGPGLKAVSGIAFDGGGRLFAVDPSLDALFAVDFDTGDRHLVTDGTRGTGPAMGEVASIQYDLARARPIVGGGEGLFAVDPATGDRVLLAPPAVADDGSLVRPGSISLDATGQRAWFTDGERIAEADLTQGTSRVLPGRFRNLDGLAAAPGAKALVGWNDYDLHAVFAIDPWTAETAVISR